MDENKTKFLKTALNNSESFQLKSLKGDASDRLYFRVIQGSNTFILMCYQKPFASLNSFLSVQKYLSYNQIAVPQVLYHDQKSGMALLEDLGDTTLEDIFWQKESLPELISFYKQTINELVKFHCLVRSKYLPCIAFDIIFDTEKFTNEMLYTQKHLLEDYCQMPLTTKMKAQLNKEFISISNQLDKEKKCMTHRDYHSRNIMMKSNKVYIIDFQDARMALCQYDLVSLLKDAYVDIDQKLEDLLIEYYITKRRELGLYISRDEFMQLYHLHCIQRCFKMCGTFVALYNINKNTRYLKYMTKPLQNILDALVYFPEYQAIKSILTNYDLVNKEYCI